MTVTLRRHAVDRWLWGRGFRSTSFGWAIAWTDPVQHHTFPTTTAWPFYLGPFVLTFSRPGW